jgi:hypothetical protein
MTDFRLVDIYNLIPFHGVQMIASRRRVFIVPSRDHWTSLSTISLRHPTRRRNHIVSCLHRVDHVMPHATHKVTTFIRDRSSVNSAILVCAQGVSGCVTCPGCFENVATWRGAIHLMFKPCVLLGSPSGIPDNGRTVFAGIVIKALAHFRI